MIVRLGLPVTEILLIVGEYLGRLLEASRWAQLKEVELMLPVLRLQSNFAKVLQWRVSTEWLETEILV